MSVSATRRYSPAGRSMKLNDQSDAGRVVFTRRDRGRHPAESAGITTTK
jgi:hypothetical protein